MFTAGRRQTAGDRSHQQVAKPASTHAHTPVVRANQLRHLTSESANQRRAEARSKRGRLQGAARREAKAERVRGAARSRRCSSCEHGIAFGGEAKTTDRRARRHTPHALPPTHKATPA